jgi:FtsZ-binding cell division protein ZapB
LDLAHFLNASRHSLLIKGNNNMLEESVTYPGKVSKEKKINYFLTFLSKPRYYFKNWKNYSLEVMERQVFEILEEKIDQAVKKVEALSLENLALKRKVEEKEVVIQNAQAQLDALEEEKELIKGKIDGILKKISRVLE